MEQAQQSKYVVAPRKTVRVKNGHARGGESIGISDIPEGTILDVGASPMTAAALWDHLVRKGVIVLVEGSL